MVKAIVAFVLISFTTITSSAQDVEYHVLYDSDKSDITEKYQSELNSLFESTPTSRIDSVVLVGHTDSDASDDYNMKLSQKRVLGVESFLIKAGIPQNIIFSSYQGEAKPRESNSDANGKQANRRVQVLVYAHPVPKVQPTVYEEPIDLCTEDTLIELASGGKYKINLCDYLANPNCVKLNEVRSAESMAEAGLTTMSEDGIALVSAGMVEYDICEGVEIKFYLPTRTACNIDGMTLWQMNDDGTWHETSKDKLVPVEVDGETYFELGLAGTGIKNCDRGPFPEEGGGSITRKSRFKVKRKSGLHLESVTIYCDCPLRGMSMTSKRKKGRKVIYEHAKDYCCPGIRVSAEATTENGAKVRLSQRPLTELEGNTCLGNCNTTERKRIWFITTLNKVIHRKYKLDREDFDEQL
ncbi:MAG: OmpA family protein [bacterium]|nr:OmpA family protein [bacterium]